MTQDPTEEMLDAGEKCMTYPVYTRTREVVADVWRAMLAAAPAQPVEQQNARHAIDGALAYGHMGINKPPSDDHWLMHYWRIGQQLAALKRPEQPEGRPAAWMLDAPTEDEAKHYGARWVEVSEQKVTVWREHGWTITPLYAAPQERNAVVEQAEDATVAEAQTGKAPSRDCAWLCKACGFRGWWRGLHCIDGKIVATDIQPAPPGPADPPVPPPWRVA